MRCLALVAALLAFAGCTSVVDSVTEGTTQDDTFEGLTMSDTASVVSADLPSIFSAAGPGLLELTRRFPDGTEETVRADSAWLDRFTFMSGSSAGDVDCGFGTRQATSLGFSIGDGSFLVLTTLLANSGPGAYLAGSYGVISSNRSGQTEVSCPDYAAPLYYGAYYYPEPKPWVPSYQTSITERVSTPRQPLVLDELSESRLAGRFTTEVELYNDPDRPERFFLSGRFVFDLAPTPPRHARQPLVQRTPPEADGNGRAPGR
ncbi:MAG: hypothetical protein AAF970_10700 [Bacteroidota bacterium]